MEEKIQTQSYTTQTCLEHLRKQKTLLINLFFYRFHLFIHFRERESTWEWGTEEKWETESQADSVPSAV